MCRSARRWPRRCRPGPAPGGRPGPYLIGVHPRSHHDSSSGGGRRSLMIRGGSVAGALGLHEVDTAAHREPTTSQVDIPPVKGAASQRRMPVAGSRRKPRAITLGCRTKPRSPIVWLPASPLPAPRGLATASRRPLGVNGGGSLIADDAVQPPAELRPEPQRRRPRSWLTPPARRAPSRSAGDHPRHAACRRRGESLDR